MEKKFKIEQRSNDFIPASGVIIINDNVEWDQEMIEQFKQGLAEIYDCSEKEITEIN